MIINCENCEYFKYGYYCNSGTCARGNMFEKCNDNIESIALEVANLVEKKNKDYGNSFDKTIAEYGDVAYFLRIEDKLSRLKSLINKDAEVNESIEDTLKDIIGYTLLMISNKRR